MALDVPAAASGWGSASSAFRRIGPHSQPARAKSRAIAAASSRSPASLATSASNWPATSCNNCSGVSWSPLDRPRVRTTPCKVGKVNCAGRTKANSSNMS
jgi:hypothetical protein